MKPWVYSDQSGRKGQRGEKIESETMILPNQLTEEDNKALGLGYTVEDDKLHVMVAVNFSKKRRKMRLGQDLLREEVREQTPDPLTRRELLSQGPVHTKPISWRNRKGLVRFGLPYTRIR